MVSDAYQAEFNNAKFAGEIQAMEGTFSGKLTAGAVNAVSGINFVKGAVAITSLATVASRNVNVNSGTLTNTGYRYIVDNIPYVASVAVNVSDATGGKIRCSAHMDRVLNTAGNTRLMERLALVLLDPNGNQIASDVEFFVMWSLFNNIVNSHPRVARDYLFEVETPGVYTVAIHVDYECLKSPGSFSSTFNNVTLLAEYIRK